MGFLGLSSLSAFADLMLDAGNTNSSCFAEITKAACFDGDKTG